MRGNNLVDRRKVSAFKMLGHYHHSVVTFNVTNANPITPISSFFDKMK